MQTFKSRVFVKFQKIKIETNTKINCKNGLGALKYHHI